MSINENSNKSLTIFKNEFSVDVFNEAKTNPGNHLNHRFRVNRACWSIRSVNVTPNGRYLVITHDYTPTIKVVDLSNLQLLPYSFNGHSSSVRQISFAHGFDPKMFYTASWDGSFRRYSLESDQCDLVIYGLNRSPSCTIDNNGKYLFSADYSDFDPNNKRAGRCWDISSKRKIADYKHQFEPLHPECVDIGVDMTMNVYTAGDCGCAYKWSLNGVLLRKYCQIESVIRKLFVSDKYLALACGNGTALVYNKKSGKLKASFSIGQREVKDVRIHNNKLYCCSDDGYVTAYEIYNQKKIFSLKCHRSFIWNISLFNNGNTICTAGVDGTICFISTSGKLIARMYNIKNKNDVLIEAFPDEAFPNGFFYTNNPELVDILYNDKNAAETKILENTDMARSLYFSKHNLKNLMITKLKNNNHFDSLKNNYIQKQKLFKNSSFPQIPKSLKA